MFTRIVLAVVCALVVPAPALAQPALGPDFTQTAWGPLGPAGRDMLVKVALAGLWEGPSGRLGLEKSANPRVQDAGRHLIEGHDELDRTVKELGGKLGVELPTEPNADQQGWLAELTAAPARSAEFDRVFANRLRAAHGTVYKFLADVRTGTRNTLIRDFAKRCMEVVLDHITVVEATGMVDFNDTKAIPLAKLPGATPPQVPRAVTSTQAPRSDGLGVDSILGVMLVVGVVLAVVLWSGGGRSSRRKT